MSTGSKVYPYLIQDRRDAHMNPDTSTFSFYWAVFKEVELSYYVGEIRLVTIYIYISLSLSLSTYLPILKQ